MDLFRMKIPNHLLGIFFYVTVFIAFTNTMLQSEDGYQQKSKTSGKGLQGYIPKDTISCNPPHCIKCNALVFRTWISEEPLKCDKNKCVRNSGCCLCGRECKTTEDIRNHLMHSNRSRMRCGRQSVTIDCCLLSQMENDRMAPSEKGQYRCYSDSVHSKYGKPTYEPLKSCPFGKKGEQCQEPNTQPVSCSCLTGLRTFPWPKNIPQCNEDIKEASTIGCYMAIVRNGIDNICFCNNSSDVNDGSVEDCYTPRVETYTDGSEKCKMDTIFHLILLYVTMKMMFIQCVVCCVVLVIPHTHAVYDNTVGSSQHDIRHEKHKQETRHYSFECQAHVSKKWIPEEPLPCGKNPLVKNSSCFLCDGQCKSEEEIQTYLTQPNDITDPIRCPTKRVTKECCLLSNMKNMGMVPSAKGQYNCYKKAVHRKHNKSVHEPLKNCPYGLKGENCNETYTQPVNCSCLNIHFTTIHWQKMTECKEEKQNESWTMCYINVTRSDKKYTCACERSKDLKQMENCLSPTADEITDTDINGSSNFEKRNNLLVLIAVSYACAIMSRQAY